MRTRAALGSIFVSFATLVVGWQAGGAVITANTVTTSAPVTAPTTTGGSTTTTTPAPVAVQPTTGAADGTYTGASVNTRYGSVQVSVTVAGGAISDVTALHLTDADGRSTQISNRAAPMLRDEVITAQSANVSNVSGATYTTQAYLSSVQSALDQAGL